jgi:DNA polymerase-3 subunit beta
MKCEVQLEKFRQAIFLTERIAGRHATLPVLSCVLLEVKKNAVFVRATNLDVGLEVELPAKADGEAIFAVPAHTLSAFLGQVGDKDQILRLETNSGNLHISIAKSKGVIKTMPADDFPAIPVVSGAKTTTFPANLLIKGFKSVWYSAAVSNVKPELASIYIYKDADSIVFAATDSFRLAERRMVLPRGSNIEDMLVPFRNAVEVVRALEAEGDTVTVMSNKNLVSFSGNGVRITSRIIDGVFPDYRQIIPKSYATEAIVLKQDFVNTLKVSTVFSDAFNQLHMAIDPKKKLFQVESKNSDVGENKSDLDAAVTGEALEINFNGKYISDSFQAIDADSMSLQFNGRNRPLVIRPVSGEQNFLYLVMPMNR